LRAWARRGDHRAAMTPTAVESVDAASETASLAALVPRIRAGSQEAFDELYRRAGPVVHGVLLSRVRPDEADELVHETFVQAHAKLDLLRDPGAALAWLSAIARNLALDRLRARRREETRTRPLPEDAPGPDAADRSAEELRARVLLHIQGLPEAYREPLVLRLVEGLTGPEIAAATGLTPGSVRVNLHRGMELLRPLLRREGYP